MDHLIYNRNCAFADHVYTEARRLEKEHKSDKPLWSKELERFVREQPDDFLPREIDSIETEQFEMSWAQKLDGYGRVVRQGPEAYKKYIQMPDGSWRLKSRRKIYQDQQLLKQYTALYCHLYDCYGNKKSFDEEDGIGTSKVGHYDGSAYETVSETTTPRAAVLYGPESHDLIARAVQKLVASDPTVTPIPPETVLSKIGKALAWPLGFGDRTRPHPIKSLCRKLFTSQRSSGSAPRTQADPLWGRIPSA